MTKNKHVNHLIITNYITKFIKVNRRDPIKNNKFLKYSIYYKILVEIQLKVPKFIST